MKIKKFNETAVYKSCTKEDLIETQKKKKEIKKKKKEILEFEIETIYPTLKDYIKLNPKIIEDENIDDIDNFSITSYHIENDWIEISYEYEENNNWFDISDNQFDDFLRYLANPKLYQDAKKYNI